MEQLQISVPNYIKQIQQEPNDIETYLDTMYLRQVKEKANIRYTTFAQSLCCNK